MSKAGAKEVIKRREALQKILAAKGAGLGHELASILDDLTKELIELIGTEINATGQALPSEASVNAILKKIDRRIEAALGAKATAAYEAEFSSVAGAIAKGTPEIYTGFKFNTTTKNRVDAAAKIMDSGKRSKSFRSGFSAWQEDLKKISADLHRDMSRSLIQAQQNGWDRTTLANKILKSPSMGWKNLPQIGPKAHKIYTHSGALPEASALRRRAHVIARTNLTAARNQAQQDFAEEVGFTHYINVNADPVSPLCKGANSEPPLTREEWEATEWGWAPRHPNCDSDMLAVPTEQIEDTAQVIAEEFDQLQGAN